MKEKTTECNEKQQGNVLIHISLTQREYDHIEERAASEGLSLGDFLKELLCPDNAKKEPKC